MLRKNLVELKGAAEVDRDALSGTIRQEPNRRILGLFPFYLWAYNVPNPDRFEKRNLRRRDRLSKKNERREERGKEPRPFKPAGSWWRETVGEAPVLLDTALVRRSQEQMRNYMIRNGWFKARVETEIVQHKRPQQYDVRYTVFPGSAYRLREITYDISDEGIAKRIIGEPLMRRPLSSGEQFRVDRLDAQREAITRELRNRGFYTFNKELLYFEVDSALGSHEVDLKLVLVPRRIPYEGDPDSLLAVPYRQFRINSVNVLDRPASRERTVEYGDTLRLKDYTFVDQGQLKVKPRTLSRNILFSPGDFYNADRVTLTYRRISALPAVRSVNIRFNPSDESDDNQLLDCNITTLPAPRQNISLEGRGTNRGGFLGVQGAVVYTNRNIFGGAERLEVNMTGGVEAQQLLTGSALPSEDASNQLGRNVSFNTLEFGPEVALTFPRFLLPLSEELFAKSANPRTTLRANLSYQQRPDYERTRSFGALSYRWSDTDEKQWTVSPAEISLIKIFKSQAFEDQLNQIGNLFLLNSFQDHFISAARVSYTYSTLNPGRRRANTYYYRGELESAGSLLRSLYRLGGAPSDSLGSYEILGIRFAQYLKTIHDFRYYRQHNEKMATAYRITAGVGVPLENLNVLPFEKSFFGGGANDIRAWEARTLGPGSFRDPERNFDKIGDILLEANVEYRFDLVSFLEGALFVDAGNIWNIEKDPQRPGADFAFDRFYREIAVGAGLGLRFNFDFFILRLDAGLQVRDPSLDPGERWLFQPKDQYNAFIEELNATRPANRQLRPYSSRWNFNLGIGYPF